jgi:hypothetical protein
MGIASKASKLALVGTAAWLFAAGASAQADPEGGDVGASASGSGSISAGGQFGGTAPTPPPTTEPAAEPIEEDLTPGESDHSAVVGRLGVGFFGVQTLPLLDPAALPMINNQDLSAPTIGARYWLSESLGIEAALGLAIGSGDFEPPAGGTTSTSSFGFALHGGVPLALAHSGHFVFEVVPVLNFGIASGSIEVPAGMGTATTDVSGLLFEVGCKVGAEIHFGFIDLPDLSLQGTLGLTIRHESRSIEPMGGGATDISQTTVSTGVDGEPWDVFTGNIAAIYYL